MKKILLLVLVALVMVALVACGGETTTSTTTTVAPGTQGGENPGNDPGNDPGNNPGVIDPPANNLYPEFPDAKNLVSGDPSWMLINAFRMGGQTRAGTFENWHTGDDWYYVFGLDDGETMLNYELFQYDDNPDSDRVYPFPDFEWVLVVDDVPYTIPVADFYCVKRDGFNWVRMKLPTDWQFKEDGHAYDIKVQIRDAASKDILYYGWLTDPDLCGAYVFSVPKPTEMVPDPNGGAKDTEVLLTGDQIVALGGPDGAAATELYTNVFDGSFDTKLCTRDMTKYLTFQIADSVFGPNFQLTSISIVGANDDASEKGQIRTLSKFRLEGSDNPDDADSWTTVLDVNKRDDFGEVVNFGERHYELSTPANYQYYRLVVVDPQADTKSEIYQLSEILVYMSAQ